MRHILLTGAAIAAMLFPCAVAAQEGIIAISFAPQNTRIMNQRDINPDRRAFQYSPTFGYAVHMIAGWHFSPPFGIHSGIIYSKQGQISTSMDENTNETFTLHRELEYIKVPLMLHFTTDPARVMGFMGFGPSLAFLRNATHWESPSTELATNYDAKELYKQADLLLSWQIGVDIGLAPKIALMFQHVGDMSLGDAENKNFASEGAFVFSRDRGITQNLTLALAAGIKFVLVDGPKYYCGPPGSRRR